MIVQPLSKKASLDPLVLNNLRPISKLPFMIMISFDQVSGPCETVLVKVTNDFLLTADSGACSVRPLLAIWVTWHDCFVVLTLTLVFD